MQSVRYTDRRADKQRDIQTEHIMIPIADHTARSMIGYATVCGIPLIPGSGRYVG